MCISKDYLCLQCIKEMTEDYRKSFNKLASVYGDKLNKGILNSGDKNNGKLFTMHDFDHHCFNIFRIISEILLVDNIKILNQKELYILNLSVLFHDISMATNINWKRIIHSKQSAEYIENEYNNKKTPLYSEYKYITQNDINALKLIVAAHSNIKDGITKDGMQGLKNPQLTNNLPSKPQNIRGKFLAGILRIADELDITNDRLANAEFEEQLYSEDDISESADHWKRLHYFKNLKIDDNDYTKIIAICDDNYLQKQVLVGDSVNIASEIFDVTKK